MSGTSRVLKFSAIVEDEYHWTPEHRAAAKADTDSGSYDGWVAAQLDKAMRAAGDRFIAEHPDLFRLDELI